MEDYPIALTISGVILVVIASYIIKKRLKKIMIYKDFTKNPEGEIIKKSWWVGDKEFGDKASARRYAKKIKWRRKNLKN